MAMTIMTNANAMAALRTLNSTQRELSETQGRIESGYRINSARQDASSFAIAQGMRSDISGFKATKETLAIGVSTIEVASSAAKRISDGLIDLQNQIAKGQAENLDQTIIQRDVDQRLELLNGYVNAAQFNGVNLLNGEGLQVLTGLNRIDPTTLDVIFLDVQLETPATLEGLGLQSLKLDQSSFLMPTDSSMDITSSAGQTLTVTYRSGQPFDHDNDSSTPDVVTWDDDGDPTTPEVGQLKTATFELVNPPGAPLTPVSETDDVFAVVLDPTASTLTNLGRLIDTINGSGLGFTMSMDNAGTLKITGGSVEGVVTDLTGVTSPATTMPGALDAVDAAQRTMKDIMAQLGSAANRLQAQSEFVQELQDNLQLGVSTLVDADLAAESARLQALQTREQLGVQSLSIANQAAQTVLSLFK